MNNNKKILFLVEAMGGGVFTYIVDLANELSNDYEMYIAYAVRPQTPEDYRDYFDSRIQLIEVKNFTRSIGVVKDIKAFFEIRRIARDVKPDIIHLHSSKAGVLGRWAFNGYKIPLYYTPHGYSFLMSNYGTVKRMVFQFIEWISAKRHCTTISCSIGEHQETLKLTKRAVYINNGINIEELDEAIDSITVSEHPYTVFTLGRICCQKNPVLFNKIAESMPDVRFLWIGDGELRHALMSGNIEITGWIERDEALKEAMSGDVFLLTSLWEGLPISLLEAMYIRKPCIVSDVIGNHDVIKNGVNGYVCQDESSFKLALEKCRGMQEKWITDNAYKDVIDHYNTKYMAKQYARIYSGGVLCVTFHASIKLNYYFMAVCWHLDIIVLMVAPPGRRWQHEI